MEVNKKTLMSVFIAVIMIVSVIGFALTFSAPKEKQEYNGYKFVRTSQGWQTKVNNIKVYFYSLPQELSNVNLDEGTKTALNSLKVVWLSYDPQDKAAPEIADTLYYMEDALGTIADVYVQRGLENNTGYTLPQVTCENATAAVPVIILQSSNETKVAHENGCIIATASHAQEIYSVGDRLLYQVFGVMK